MQVHLFLSPHPDDIPLSCGGTVYHLTQDVGAEVIILTIMAGDPMWILPDTPLVRELHERWSLGQKPSAARRAEDIEAGQVLGARVEHTPIPDCIYRVSKGEALYPTGKSIMATPHPMDDAYDLLMSIGQPERDRVTHFYIPMSAGNHVDHQIVRDAGIAMMKRNKTTDGLTPQAEVWFYEDYPYAAREGTVAAALTHLERHVGKCEAHTRPISEEAMQAKLNSIARYRSQISTFWPDVETMSAEVRTFMTEVGGGAPAERFWRIQP